MKAYLVILGLLLAWGSCAAADLTLTDGRTFRDASVMSQTPLTVVIKHAEGLSSVPKTALPPEFAVRYPIDEAAAREAEAQAIVARAKAQEFHQAEAKRSALIRLERETAEAERAQLAAQDADQREAELAAESKTATDRAETNNDYAPYRRSYYYPYSPFAISSPYNRYRRDHHSSDNRFNRHRDSSDSDRNHRRPDVDCEVPVNFKPKSTHFDRLTDRPATKSLERDHQQRLNTLESEHVRQRHSAMSGTATRNLKSTCMPRHDTGASVSATGTR